MELVAPVEDPELRAELLDVLERCFAENANAWELGADGEWTRLTPPDGEAVTVFLGQDGNPLPKACWGEDVFEETAGCPVIRVDRPGMYRLVRHDAFVTRTLSLKVASGGLRAYAFTFVSCPSDD